MSRLKSSFQSHRSRRSCSSRSRHHPRRSRFYSRGRRSHSKRTRSRSISHSRRVRSRSMSQRTAHLSQSAAHYFVSKPFQTEWTLHQTTANAIFLITGNPNIDLSSCRKSPQRVTDVSVTYSGRHVASNRCPIAEPGSHSYMYMCFSV